MLFHTLLLTALAATTITALPSLQLAQDSTTLSLTLPQEHSAPSLQARGKYTCHDSGDSIGDYCWFFDTVAFTNAIKTYYRKFVILIVSDFGISYPEYYDGISDGKGDTQKFRGNMRADRPSVGAQDQDVKIITYANCKNDLMSVMGDCGGYGGFENKDYGTAFAECIRA